MAKLYFRFGAMGASKTANALMVRFNYEEKGKNPLMLKPIIDTRDNGNIITSRIGLSSECMYVEDFLKRVKANNSVFDWDAVIVDECQFLSVEQIEDLASVVDKYNVPVICYGLKTDFEGHLFEGAKRLIELADVIEEIPTICWCGHKAHFNARVADGKIVRHGAQVEIGANDKYVSLCRKHYLSGSISAEHEDKETKEKEKYTVRYKNAKGQFREITIFAPSEEAALEIFKKSLRTAYDISIKKV